MAKLTAIPALQIIKGFRGIIDFYVHDGQACARKWPTKGKTSRTPGVIAASQVFAYVQRYTTNPDPLFRLFATMAAADAPSTWRDITLVSYYGLLIDEDPPPFTPFQVTCEWP